MHILDTGIDHLLILHENNGSRYLEKHALAVSLLEQMGFALENAPIPGTGLGVNNVSSIGTLKRHGTAPCKACVGDDNRQQCPVTVCSRQSLTVSPSSAYFGLPRTAQQQSPLATYSYQTLFLSSSLTSGIVAFVALRAP